MTDKDETIEIDLEKPATTEEVEVVQVQDKEPELRSVQPEEGIEALRAQLAKEQKDRETERRQKEEAQRRAAALEHEAYRAKNDANDANMQFLTNAIDTVKRTQVTLKSELAQAFSNNDFDKAADVQMKMSESAARLGQLESGKAAMESRPKAQAPAPANPLDELIANVERNSPASADWLKQNRSRLDNTKTINRMFRAHQDAIDDGITADSPDYFAFIEDRLGFSDRQEPRQRQQAVEVEEEPDATAEAAKVVQRRSSPPAAPVTRSGAAPGTKPNTVRLTAAEREMASMMNMTEQEYARNKLALQREGKLH